jgi:hypothetical protein
MEVMSYKNPAMRSSILAIAILKVLRDHVSLVFNRTEGKLYNGRRHV